MDPDIIYCNTCRRNVDAKRRPHVHTKPDPEPLPAGDAGRLSNACAHGKRDPDTDLYRDIKADDGHWYGLVHSDACPCHDLSNRTTVPDP